MFQQQESTSKRWTRYIKLMFYIEIAVILAWGCWMIVLTHRFRVDTEHEITDMVHERFPPMLAQPQAEAGPSAKVPAIFVGQIILNSPQGPREGTESIEQRDITRDDKTTDGAGMWGLVAVQSDNALRASDDHVAGALQPWWLPSIADSSRDEKLEKERQWWETVPSERVKTVINEDDGRFYLYPQILQKLRDVVPLRALSGDSGVLNGGNVFATDSIDRSTSNDQMEDSSSDAFAYLRSALQSSRLQDWKIDVSAIDGSSRDSARESADLAESTTQADDDGRESEAMSSSVESSEGEHERMSEIAMLRSLLSRSRESTDDDASSKYTPEDPTISMMKQEISRKLTDDAIGDIPSADVAVRSEDRPEIAGDGDASAPVSPDVTGSDDDPPLSLHKLMTVLRDKYPSSEITENAKEDEEEEYKSAEDREESFKSSESSADKFDWYVPPARFANDNPQIPKSDDATLSETRTQEDEISREDFDAGNAKMIQFPRLTGKWWNPSLPEFDFSSDDYFDDIDINDDTIERMKNKLSKSSDVTTVDWW